MAIDASLLDWIVECVEPVGTVTHRAMMGGATLYCEGVPFAILDGSEGQLWFKADKVSDAIWDDAGCARFTFTFDNGRVGSMNYRRAPEDVHDDPDAMRQWARLGIEAGHRAPVKKARSKKKSNPV